VLNTTLSSTRAHPRVHAAFRTTTMKTALLVALLASPALAAPPPTPVYSNASTNPNDPGLATGSTSASGVAAPVGSQWSELQRDASNAANAIAGFSANRGVDSAAYRFADDFTVGGFPYGWNITNASFYVYRSGAASTPVSGAFVRIWNGRPGDPGAAVVWGDLSTDRLASSWPLNIYRIFNSVTSPDVQAPSSNRRIWQVSVNTPGLQLASGSYWIEWQFTGAGGSEVYVPAVTPVASRGKPGANARQFKPLIAPGGATDQWADLLDLGKPSSAADLAQDLPFIITASPGLPPCPGNADASASVNFTDVTAVLANFGTAYFPASGPGDTDGDGYVNFSDLTTTLANFGNACP
jgi:hypothetical protein